MDAVCLTRLSGRGRGVRLVRGIHLNPTQISSWQESKMGGMVRSMARNMGWDVSAWAGCC